MIANADTWTAFGTVTADKLEAVDRVPTGSMEAEVVIRNEAYDVAVLRLTGVAPEHFIDILHSPAINESVIERRVRIIATQD